MLKTTRKDWLEDTGAKTSHDVYRFGSDWDHAIQPCAPARPTRSGSTRS